MNNNQRVIEFVDRRPEEVSVERVIEDLYFWKKVQVGLCQADAGELISHEEIEREFQSENA